MDMIQYTRWMPRTLATASRQPDLERRGQTQVEVEVEVEVQVQVQVQGRRRRREGLLLRPRLRV